MSLFEFFKGTFLLLCKLNCTEVEKLTICEELFLFIVWSLYLYLQDDHQMCLVDTRIGVASGEALFYIVHFALDCDGKAHITATAAH